jgi:hypothetical protein
VSAPEAVEDRALRLAALVALLSAALGLRLGGLIPMPVCLLALALLLLIGLAGPRWFPRLVNDQRPRTVVALAAIGLMIIISAGSGSHALFSGGLSDPLGAAVAALGLPSGVPIGLLATLAAGALVAVALELGDRRGVQSALVFTIAVLSLASVAAPGRHMLPALVPGWPAVLLAIIRLAATVPRLYPVVGPPPSSPPPPMYRDSASGRPLAGVPRAEARWHLLPPLLVIGSTLVVLALAVMSGVTSLGERTHHGSFSGSPASTGGRTAADYLGGEMDLTARGSLGQEPVMDVSADSPRLWRAGTVDLYTGRSWYASEVPSEQPKFVVGSDGTATLVGPGAPATPARTDQVRSWVWARETQIMAPGRLLGLSSAELGPGSTVLSFPGDRVMLINGGGEASYQVRSQVLPSVDDPDAAAALAAVPDAGDRALEARWTALPDSVPERVRRLGRTLVTGAPNRLAAVHAIEAELAARMTYSLDSPVPPPGADAVDDVLFVSHSGFCEQFASAEVVLLRAAGVPARVAVGFSGGTPSSDGFRTVVRADAHAWAEVWFPGTGWVTSDPTPAAVETQAWWKPMWDAVRSLVRRALTWIVVALLVLLALVAGLLRRSLRSGPPAPSGPDLDPDLAAAFARLEAALRAEGRPRAESETVAALAQRLAWPVARDPASDRLSDRVLNPGSGPALAQTLPIALNVLERALYAPEPPSRRECLAAAAVIDRRAQAASAPTGR